MHCNPLWSWYSYILFAICITIIIFLPQLMSPESGTRLNSISHKPSTVWIDGASMKLWLFIKSVGSTFLPRTFSFERIRQPLTIMWEASICGGRCEVCPVLKPHQWKFHQNKLAWGHRTQRNKMKAIYHWPPTHSNISIIKALVFEGVVESDAAGMTAASCFQKKPWRLYTNAMGSVFRPEQGYAGMRRATKIEGQSGFAHCRMIFSF